MDTRWIREGLTKAGKSQADLARHLNLTPPQVTRILAGARRIKADEINRIRQFLGLAPVAMTAGTARPPDETWRNPAEIVLPDGATPVANTARDLPIFGAAQYGADGRVGFDHQGPIDWTWRAPELLNVRGAFAIYASGESMGDAIPEGAIVQVHPHRGPLPGRKCLVLVRGKGAFLKIWVGRRGDRVVVRQTNPPEEITWPAADVQAVYRVVAVVEG